MDNTGNWLIIDQPHDATLLINNIESKKFLLDSEILSLGALLYSKTYNKFYLFYDYSDDENLTGLQTFSSKADNIQTLLLLPSSDFRVNRYNREAFLSKDEKTIYFAIEDTNYTDYEPQKFRMSYFSTESNSIIRDRQLSEVGYPGAFSHDLNKGIKGISVVSSFYRNSNGKVDNLFRVYNFDIDSGYAFIKSLGWSVPYFTHNGKYLVLSRIYDDTTKHTLYNKGVFDVFNSQTGEFLKTINYPPKRVC